MINYKSKIIDVYGVDDYTILIQGVSSFSEDFGDETFKHSDECRVYLSSDDLMYIIDNEKDETKKKVINQHYNDIADKNHKIGLDCIVESVKESGYTIDDSGIFEYLFDSYTPEALGSMLKNYLAKQGQGEDDLERFTNRLK